ncbi:MAG TPA: hypothetical protein VNG90_04360 [Candidatus Acidoferrum sp.]|nr:hypothetical protein [Candidatus Acidoferrum sp.]
MLNKLTAKISLYHWVAALLGLLLVVGAYTDGWAHHHLAHLETFFTPWHAVLYGSFALNGLFYAGTAFLSYRKSRIVSKALLPHGYFLSLIGVVIFTVGGVTDMIWHILFGIEANIDALYSPTHLVLAGGAFLIVTGPLRAAFYGVSQNNTLLQKLPMVVSLAMTLSILTFMTQLSHPLVNVYGGSHLYTTDARAFEDEHARGIESIMLQSAIVVGLLFYVLKRVALPAGSFVVIFTLNTTLLAFLEDHYLFIPMAIVAGFAIDVLYHLLRPSVSRLGRMRWFGLLLPVIFYSFYFAVVLATQGTHWTIHMVTGCIVLAGISGFLLSYPSFGFANPEKPIP